MGKGNKYIPKIDIYTEVVLDKMKQKHISFRKLGQILGCKDGGYTMLWKYIHTGKCPAHILNPICDALCICPSEVMKGKTVWMRIGVTVQLDDQDYKWIMDREKSGYGMAIPDHIARKYLRQAVQDGDSYIPIDQPFFKEEEDV